MTRTAIGNEVLHASDVAALWAETTAANLLENVDPGLAVPAYGTPHWGRLTTTDPRRSVAVITAAEMWRRGELERHRLGVLMDTDPELWFREVTRDADRYAARMCRALASVPTHSELAQRRQHRPAAPVVATPGWSVAMPGQPGWWRHSIDGEQIDLPYRETAPERRAAA